MTWFDDKEAAIIPLARRLFEMPELKAGDEAYNAGEFQLALEWYLNEAAKKQIPVPAGLVESARKISAELIPPKRNGSLLTYEHELVAA